MFSSITGRVTNILHGRFLDFMTEVTIDLVFVFVVLLEVVAVDVSITVAEGKCATDSHVLHIPHPKTSSTNVQLDRF